MPVRGLSRGKPILVDPSEPAAAAGPAIISRALLHRQPLSGVVNPFELAANAGGVFSSAAHQRGPRSGISYFVQWSEPAWSGVGVGPLGPSPHNEQDGAPSAADPVGSFSRHTVPARSAAAIPASPFAALSDPQQSAGSPILTGADDSGTETSAGTSSPSRQAGKAAAPMAGSGTPSLTADQRAATKTSPAVDAEHSSPSAAQAAMAAPHLWHRSLPPPLNPFADFRGGRLVSGDDTYSPQPSSESVADPLGQQPAAAPANLPTLDDGDAHWAWPVHRADERLPAPNAVIGSKPPAEADGSFGAIGSGPALTAQRAGAGNCHMHAAPSCAQPALSPVSSCCTQSTVVL